MATSRSNRGIYILLGIALVAVMLVAAVAVLATRSPSVLPDAAKLVNAEQLKANVSRAFQGNIPLAVNRSSSNAQTCECVGYVVNTLFGGPRSGNWPTAESMADSRYWSQDDVVKTDGKRTRSQTAARDDVIIMQHDAVVYAYNTRTNDFDKLTSIGCSSTGCAGHIGLVREAEYYNDARGWLILMRSANWSNKDWAISSVRNDPCSNVVDAYVFIPNGDKVSFWRRSR